jgi:hypothetical protein
VNFRRLRWNQSFSHGEELNADGESGKPRINATVGLTVVPANAGTHNHGGL